MLVEPFLLPVTDEQQVLSADLDLKRAVVAELAAEYRAAFVPLQSILGEAAASLGPLALAADGVHPTPYGHALIAEAWLGAVGSREEERQ